VNGIFGVKDHLQFSIFENVNLPHRTHYSSRQLLFPKDFTCRADEVSVIVFILDKDFLSLSVVIRHQFRFEIKASFESYLPKGTRLLLVHGVILQVEIVVVQSISRVRNLKRKRL
jgi:hypothetical protein